MGNLIKSKETTPTNTTVLKGPIKGSNLEDHFPQELKSPFRTSLHKLEVRVKIRNIFFKEHSPTWFDFDS